MNNHLSNGVGISSSNIRQRTHEDSNGNGNSNGSSFSGAAANGAAVTSSSSSPSTKKLFQRSKNFLLLNYNNKMSMTIFGSGFVIGCILSTFVWLLRFSTSKTYVMDYGSSGHGFLPPHLQHVGKFPPPPLPISYDIQNSSDDKIRLSIKEHRTKPPSNLIVRGSRTKFTQCPIDVYKKVWIDLTNDQNIHRAFRLRDWIVDVGKNQTLTNYQVLWRKSGHPKDEWSIGQPWQRYSRIPGFRNNLESKDGFIAGLKRFKSKVDPNNKQDLIYFIPETYQLTVPKQREEFIQVLNNEKLAGRSRPWVLKKPEENNGKGVMILEPNSPKIYDAISDMKDDELELQKAKKSGSLRTPTSTKKDNGKKILKSPKYIIQSYVCNELSWFYGQKFDLRFFWLVISVDPLIILYQDGYVRVGGSQYNETDFTSTGQHLTNHGYRGLDNDDHVDNVDLWRRVQQHYDQNYDRLSKIIGPEVDPIQHVRNQIKEAIGTLGEAFKDDLSLYGRNKEYSKTNKFENLFGFFGADFIIDADLDVYLIEAQSSPGMGQKQDFRIDVFRRLFRPLVAMLEELYHKQVESGNGQSNVYPIQNLGDYEIVYLGDNHQQGNIWRYRYEGYKRSKNKIGCTVS